MKTQDALAILHDMQLRLDAYAAIPVELRRLGDGPEVSAEWGEAVTSLLLDIVGDKDFRNA